MAKTTGKITLGTIWKNKKTGKTYEFVGQNLETKRIQLATFGNGEQTHTCMKEKSLRRNYSLVSISADKQTPEQTETAGVESKPITRNLTRWPPGRIELPDGRVIPGIRFLLDIAKKTEEETCKKASVIYWLANSDAGKELLKQFNAKIVYEKPLTK